MFTAVEALGLVMAVLDESPPLGDPTDPVGSALSKIMPSPAGSGRHPGPKPIRRTPATGALIRFAARPRPGDHHHPRPRLLEPPNSTTPLPLRGQVGLLMEVDPWAVIVRRGRWYLLCRSHKAGRPAGVPDRPCPRRGGPRRDVHPPRRPRSGRHHPRGEPRRRLGVRDRSGRSTRRSRRWPCAFACSVWPSRSIPGRPVWSSGTSSPFWARATSGGPIPYRIVEVPRASEPREQLACSSGGVRKAPTARPVFHDPEGLDALCDRAAFPRSSCCG